MRDISILLMLFCGNIAAEAQSFLKKQIFLSPSLTIGYTLGARVNYGIDLDFGYTTTDKHGSVYRTGLSVSQYFVEAKHHTARILSANVMFQKDFTDLKAGIARLQNKWGYQNRNTSTTYGFSYDLSLRLPDQAHNSWFGIRHMVCRPADWPWFEIPYTSVYLKFKYELINPAVSAPRKPLSL